MVIFHSYVKLPEGRWLLVGYGWVWLAAKIWSVGKLAVTSGPYLDKRTRKDWVCCCSTCYMYDEVTICGWHFLLCPKIGYHQNSWFIYLYNSLTSFSILFPIRLATTGELGGLMQLAKCPNVLPSSGLAGRHWLPLKHLRSWDVVMCCDHPTMGIPKWAKNANGNLHLRQSVKA